MDKSLYQGKGERYLTNSSGQAAIAGQPIEEFSSVDSANNETGSASITHVYPASKLGELQDSTTDQSFGRIGIPPVDRIREINRAITRKTLLPEKNKLIEERNTIVGKKFDGGLSKREERRLTLVRWQLDRLDDAEFGEGLDFVETVTEEHEKFAQEINHLLDQLKTDTRKRRS